MGVTAVALSLGLAFILSLSLFGRTRLIEGSVIGTLFESLSIMIKPEKEDYTMKLEKYISSQRSRQYEEHSHVIEKGMEAMSGGTARFGLGRLHIGGYAGSH